MLIDGQAPLQQVRTPAHPTITPAVRRCPFPDPARYRPRGGGRSTDVVYLRRILVSVSLSYSMWYCVLPVRKFLTTDCYYLQYHRTCCMYRLATLPCADVATTDSRAKNDDALIIL